MNSKFTEKARKALDASQGFARELGHTYIGTEHVLLGLLSVTDGMASRILFNNGVETEKIREQIKETVGTGSKSTVKASDMTPMTKRIIEESARLMSRTDGELIGTEHLLWAIADEVECYANRMIREAGASVSDIKSEISKTVGHAFSEGGGKKADRGENDAVAGCPTLSKYGKDLCKSRTGRDADPVIGRERETERLIQILSRRTKNNPCLIGEPGVGKTAVVEGLAHRIVKGDVPPDLQDKIIVTLDIASVIAGAKYRGEFEERMHSILSEVDRDRRIILFVDEIHVLVGAGGAEGAVDAANMIKPALARGRMQLIGATTAKEYARYIEKDAALERRFQAVTVEEPTAAETVEILRGIRDKYEAHHRLKIDDSAILSAVELSARYIGDRYLPDKAIDLLDEAASRLRLYGNATRKEVADLRERARQAGKEKENAILCENFESAARWRDTQKELLQKAVEIESEDSEASIPILMGEHIENMVTEWTGIPVKASDEREGEMLLGLEERLKNMIFGQDRAVEKISLAIRRNRSGLSDPKRPVGSFIFLGPTGVGKTALAKALCEIVYKDKRSMVRLDMSEYMERHSVSKLIGSPPGYVGFGEGGQLTERVRRKPYCVVLLDEIEKAHPDVLNILLQILDEGILTDSEGRRVDFKNTLIIMTSNAVTAGTTAQAGFFRSSEEREDKEKKALSGAFSFEFLNRVDEVVTFERLSPESVVRIAEAMLENVKKRAEDKGVEIEFSEEVCELIAKKGYDSVYGARPLRRTVATLVEDPLAKKLLSGEIEKGMCIEAFVKNMNVEYLIK